MSRNLIVLTFLFLPAFAVAQTPVAEPEFSNTIHFITKDNKSLNLELQAPQTKVSSSASQYIVGIGKTKAMYMVKGEKSEVRIPRSDTLKFIVRVADHNENPFQIISIARLKSNPKKHTRYLDVAEVGAFKGSSTVDIDRINFKAVKYGNYSYLVTIPSLEQGEYAIALRDDPATWQLFGID